MMAEMVQALIDRALQELCERGQAELMRTEYLPAAVTLGEAEARAWATGDFDTLSRLYLPLQEAHRQIRQRCGEGAVRMRCFNQNARDILASTDRGLLLVAGSANIGPAVELRRLATERSLYVQTFLGALYPTSDAGQVVVIVPQVDGRLPSLEDQSVAELKSALPPHSLVVAESELPMDVPKGTAESFAAVMDLWERLHQPFLLDAAHEPDPIRRMQKYRDTLKVDPACELAHQFLADIARNLARRR
jgi:hypothetical protein